MKTTIESLISQLTLEEKLSLLAGADSWTTTPVERLGIPAMKVSDGPNGARGSQSRGGMTSACFPAGVALAATWNTELVEEVGRALAQETKSKGAHILLAPTVNIHRSGLSGRNFECYSEDPILSGRMAVATIRGLQSQGVGACLKHFACNDSEFERMSLNVRVDERPLREIYLRPFQMALQEANPWAVMSAYNKVNGAYCSENSYLLNDILKGEWGFDGLVMSDWFGTYSPAVANGGLDLEMPGPSRWLGPALIGEVRRGEISEATIDDKVRRLLRTLERVGAFASPEPRPERADDRPEHRALIRRAAAEAIVLLKNDGGVLPLDRESLHSIAVIGANARWTPIMGGGSARVTPHYAVTALQGLQNSAGRQTAVHYAIGCPNFKWAPVLEMARTTGWAVEYFANADCAGEPVGSHQLDRSEIQWGDWLPESLHGQPFSVRLRTTFTAPEEGRYTFSLISGGRSRLLVNGALLIDNWEPAPGEAYYGFGSLERKAQVTLAAGETRQVTAEYGLEYFTPFPVLRVGCLPPISERAIEEAMALAAQCDVALVFAGLSGEWESEGRDRPDMELPGDQGRLIEAVAAANPRTAVILNSGSPVTMPWLDRVAAVVQAWYGGQEAGNALADILFGDANPSGRLPQTFPQRLVDNPAAVNYPGENGQVLYGEGLFVGYRYYDKKQIAPLFPFGYGLSYTTFAYSNLRLNGGEFGPGDTIEIRIDIENTGRRAGQEVVQLYMRDVASRLTRPAKELRAFAKVALEPGETRTITLTLDEAALAYYDPAGPGWVVEAGEFEVLAGSSSQDIHLAGRFTWKGKTAT
ncbi:MAG: glycoside hydrolase family 3 C-terminal domain-containing protein [Chloroflexi bacterium]|nr:glycoside hydrolase family 3 C-terminal domain-containing protein [Chloroflexota bacterium]MCI0576312.1 glycoside hydrolase family 3 C-terminal domain-containing protein [Chloroflexota bacterium]MCI0650019.1 glycoside hydrolase family 3 C-terminal domain-containing protein [Chloroflexota bacterium]MCI0730497.1 glycoside hydrolase family 3 C-terminal domain-containing protein [Chloroflexota bacterium]